MVDWSAGDERPGSIPADIVFIIDEKPHAVFQRDGNDLIYTAKLPLVDALCGATIKMNSIDGRPLTVRCFPISVRIEHIYSINWIKHLL